MTILEINMKNHAALLLSLILAASVQAQTLYLPNGTVGVSTTTNAGFGTSNPTKLLDVNGPTLIRGGTGGIGAVTQSGIYFFDDGSTSYLSSRNNDGSRRNLVMDAGLYQIATSGLEHIRIATNGYMGIGTTNPLRPLHVVGAFAVGNGNPGTWTTNGSDIFLNAGTPNSAIHFRPNGDGSGVGSCDITAGGVHSFYDSTGALQVIFANGNVGIGTSNPSSKLAVNGTIQAKEIVVQSTGWSDYVFSKDYNLTSLSEVERTIKSEGHLPGVPTADEITKSGINVGRIQSVLLAKIEELTLHVIELEKEVKQLKQTHEQVVAERNTSK